MSDGCKGINRDGTPCQARPFADQAYCPWHDPNRQEALTESRRLGGHNKSREARAKKLLAAGMQDLGDVRDVLMLAILECRGGKIDPKMLTAIATAARASMALTVGVELEEQIAEAQRAAGDLAGRIGA